MDACLSILEIIFFDGGQDYNKVETEETVHSFFPSAKDLLSFSVYCALCFPIKLLQNVIPLYDIPNLNKTEFVNKDERPKQNKPPMFYSGCGLLLSMGTMVNECLPYLNRFRKLTTPRFIKTTRKKHPRRAEFQ